MGYCTIIGMSFYSTCVESTLFFKRKKLKLDTDGWSAIAAAFSTIAAIASFFISKSAFNSQKEMIFFEREKHLYEQLRADSKRASDNAGEGYPKELTFSQASNICQALNSASDSILSFTSDNKKANKDKYIRYFRQHLAEQVNAYLSCKVPASIYSKDPTVEQVEAISLWTYNRRFFNFRYCEDEDLSNQDED